MEKIKKILTIYLTLFITLCNFSVVLADDEIENEQEQEQEIIENNNNDIQEQIDNINNEINDINNDINNEIKPLLTSVSNPTISGNYGRAIDLSFFNDITNDFLIKSLYDYYDSYDFIFARRLVNGSKLFFFNLDDINTISFDTENNRYIIKLIYYDQFNSDGTINYNLSFTETFYYYLDRYTLNSPFNNYIWFKFTYNDDNLYFKPFKFNLISNIENYTYTSGIFNYYYPNQIINVSYTGDTNSFYGWYDTDLQQTISKNPTYVFSINKDTNLKLITNDEYVDIMLGLKNDDKLIDIVKILKIIFVVILLIAFKSLIWGV